MINEKELREGRKYGLGFSGLSSLPEYCKKIQEIFSNGEKLPLVVGPHDINPERLEVRYIVSPATNLDLLKVKDFCTRMELLEKNLGEQNYSGRKRPDLEASIFWGVDDTTKYRRGETFLGTSLHMGNEFNYGLYLQLGYDKITEYTAKKIERVPWWYKILSGSLKDQE